MPRFYWERNPVASSAFAIDICSHAEPGDTGRTDHVVARLKIHDPTVADTIVAALNGETGDERLKERIANLERRRDHLADTCARLAVTATAFPLGHQISE